MKKVLLIYDKETAVDAHSRSLYYMGVYPMVSHDIDDAKNLASYAKYDLVVIDLLDNDEQMSELVLKFKELDLKIIALATDYTEERSTLYRSLGCDEVIAKPMHTREFMNHICRELQIEGESKFHGDFAWGY